MMPVTEHPGHDDRRDAARAVAQLWARNGVPAFPVRIGYDQTLYDGSGGTTKQPATINGHLNATTDLAELDRLFDVATCAPGQVFGAAILPGGGEYVVVDIDLKGGKNGFPAAEHLGLLETWGAATPSGGQHRIFRRPTGVRITNSSPWAADGIDIRGDDGWIVAPGTDTPWGKWRKIDDERRWPDDVADLPVDILARLTTTTGDRAYTTWNRYSAENASRLDPATRRAVDALVAAGGHSPIVRERDGREPWVEITRPGKRAGTSASVGYVGPGIVRSFTPNWPGVPDGRNEIADDGRIVPAGARYDEWVERIAQAPPHVDPETGELVETPSGLAAYRVDWPGLWSADDDDEWLCEPIIAASRAHALYAPAKTGKSLIITWIAAMLATGRPCFDRPGGEPVPVVYCDLEMTPADLRDRLGDMGFGPDDDLERLHWLSLPPLLLDTADGAQTLADYAAQAGAGLVIIDTTARAVSGEENSADTYRAFARWTGIALKRRGIAYVRTDHAGKDADKGQRGSSAKNDDVDVVWRYTARDQGSFLLESTHRRMGWVPSKVVIAQTDGPLAYHLPPEHSLAWPAGTAEVAARMDDAGIPLGPSDRAVLAACRAAGIVAKNAVLRAAAKYRRTDLRRQETEA